MTKIAIKAKKSPKESSYLFFGVGLEFAPKGEYLMLMISSCFVFWHFRVSFVVNGLCERESERGM